MAGSINKVILVGNLGREPEIRYSQDGSRIATFSIATSETWKDKNSGERKDNTQWHRIVVFNDNLAEIVEKYVKKGNKVYVEGSLQTRKYTGADGIERNITEVVISRFKGEIHILDSKNSVNEDEYSNVQSPEESSFTKSSMSSSKNVSSNSNNEDFSTGIGDDLDDEIPF